MNYDNFIKIPVILLEDNSYLADKLNLGVRAITRLLKELSDNNYIKMEFKHKFIRKIFIVNEINKSINLDYKD